MYEICMETAEHEPVPWLTVDKKADALGICAAIAEERQSRRVSQRWESWSVRKAKTSEHNKAQLGKLYQLLH